MSKTRQNKRSNTSKKQQKQSFGERDVLFCSQEKLVESGQEKLPRVGFLWCFDPRHHTL